jgi:hypothetical protein
MFDHVQMGYWLVLPYHTVYKIPHLRLAPSRVVPQREHHLRPIMDYSFYGTNQACKPMAPFTAMQFGGTLQWLLQ